MTSRKWPPPRPITSEVSAKTYGGPWATPLRTCGCAPTLLVVKPGWVRMVRDWSNTGHGLGGVSVNPDSDGTMDGFLAMLGPGSYVEGQDLQGCFLRWLVAPASRRPQWVLHLVAGRL